MDRFLIKWGEFIQRYRWIVISFWVLLIAGGGYFGGQLQSVLTGGGWDVKGSQSHQASVFITEQLEGRSGTSLTMVVRDPENSVGTQQYSKQLDELIRQLKQEESVEMVYSWLDAPEEAKDSMMGEDANTSIAFVNLNIDEGFAINILPAMQERFVEQADLLGLEAYLLGTSAFWGDVSVYSQEGLARAELIALPIIFIILLLVFRSFVAAITPMIVTVSSVVVTMGIIYLVGQQVELSIFITNAAVMLGLGIGIDYSLIIVNRFRKELAEHHDTNKAIVRMMQTAGHTIIFSGITVIAAMSALFVVKLAAIQAIAFGAAAVVFVAVLSSLTLLPAVLSLLGERINKGSISLFTNKHKKSSRRWFRWTHVMMRKPILFLALSVGFLLFLAIPAIDLKPFNPDVRILPSDSLVRQGNDLIEESYGQGITTPGSVVIHSTGDVSLTELENIEYIESLHRRIAEIEGVHSVSSLSSIFEGMNSEQISHILNSEPNPLASETQFLVNRFINQAKDVSLIEVYFTEYASSDLSREIIQKLQNQVIPDSNPPAGISLFVGGETSAGMDTNQAILDGLLPSLAIMLGLIYIILLITFRSVFLPLKAILMNLLSIGATYGVLVFVFAYGHGVELFGAEANGYIIHFVPILLLALLFSLSTDYEVFLLSRVKEEYDRNSDNEHSVALGMEATGPLISGAAVLMVTVFTGFAFSGMLPIQMLGFGMAVAILLDATIIRLVVVPVSMKLMGKWNWWFPGKSN